MSAKLMAAATYLELKAGEKLALIALAEHADEDGNGAYPGNDLLMRQASVKRRALGANLSALQCRGLVAKVAYAEGGRGHAVVWRINAVEVYRQAGVYKTERRSRKGARKDPLYQTKGAGKAPVSALKGASDDIKGAREDPPTLLNPQVGNPGMAVALDEVKTEAANGLVIKTTPEALASYRYNQRPGYYDALAANPPKRRRAGPESNGENPDEWRTEGSPQRNDPATCPHLAVEPETGWCAACSTQVIRADQ